MVIEFSNTKNTPHRSLAAPFLVFLAALFFLFPITLILIGLYSQTPTGTLISPIPEAVLSQTPTLTPPVTQATNSALVAADQVATSSSLSTDTNTNSQETRVTLPANQSELIVTDARVTADSQIFLIPEASDKAIYFVKSKKVGEFTFASASVTANERSLDYQIVNP